MILFLFLFIDFYIRFVHILILILYVNEKVLYFLIIKIIIISAKYQSFKHFLFEIICYLLSNNYLYTFFLIDLSLKIIYLIL